MDDGAVEKHKRLRDLHAPVPSILTLSFIHSYHYLPFIQPTKSLPFVYIIQLILYILFINMVRFTSVLAASAAVAGVSAAPQSLNPLHSVQKRLSSSETGTSNGYYYSFWTDGVGTIDYENGDGGEYSITWESGSGNFVGGKGWSTGSDRYVLYSFH